MTSQAMRVPFYEKPSYSVAIIGIFAPVLGIFAILAWIVPFGHITMELLMNTVIIVMLKIRKKAGTLAITGIITGILDFSAGLAGPGGFLSPIVYAFRFGFLELVLHSARGRDVRVKNGLTVVANAAGYFLTSTLVWVMYALLFIPLGNETVQQLWFVMGAMGTVVSVPATLLGIGLFQKFIEPALRHGPFLEPTKPAGAGTS